MSSTQGALHIPRPGRGVITLIVVNVVCWILYVILLRLGADAITDRLPLSPKDFFSGELWTPLTSMLIHSPLSTGHLLGNMLYLWIFGVDVEVRLGTRGLWRSYLYSGLGGSAVVLLAGLTGLVVGAPIADWWVGGTLGASGAVMGITAVWGGLHWDETRNWLFLGPVKGKTIFYIMVALQLLGVLSFDSSTSYSAHLGGLAVGLGLGRGWLRTGQLTAWRARRRVQKQQRENQERMSRFKVLDGGRRDGPKADDGRTDDGEWLN